MSWWNAQLRLLHMCDGQTKRSLVDKRQQSTRLSSRYPYFLHVLPTTFAIDLQTCYIMAGVSDTTLASIKRSGRASVWHDSHDKASNCISRWSIRETCRFHDFLFCNISRDDIAGPTPQQGGSTSQSATPPVPRRVRGRNGFHVRHPRTASRRLGRVFAIILGFKYARASGTTIYLRSIGKFQDSGSRTKLM